MIPPIIDADIDWAERMLGGDISFDEDARAFIRTLASVQVVACPGSGKTTALAAKLLILSRHLPLPANRGICVLTHTNVAIDEITRGLSSIGSAILSYPSFCGTFQSFVGRFLGYPGYVEDFGHRPSCVDSEVTSRELQHRSSVALEKARFYLKKQGMSIEGLRFNKHLQVVKIGENIPFVGANTPTYATVSVVKKDVLRDGYLFYEDSYVFAQRHLDRHPGVPKLFRNRFPFVLVDEMQDTEERQLEILTRLFGEGATTQLVGDPNQAIYWRTDVGTGCSWSPPADVLTLPRSLRFDQPIADVVTRLASVAPITVHGNGAGVRLMPHLIVFPDERIHEVLPTFAGIIAQLDLQRLLLRPSYKAVGWVAKEHEGGKHTVPSYWPAFSAAQGRRRAQYATLRGNLSICASPPGVDFPRQFRRAVVASMASFFRAGGTLAPSGRRFTEATALDHLRETSPSVLHELETASVDWCLKAHSGRDVTDVVAAFLVDALTGAFGIDTSLPAAKVFLGGDDSEETPEEVGAANRFLFEGGAIEVSSVHAVKSETHTATLFLETFYHGYDVHRLLPYLKGSIPSGDELPRVKESLKVAFVACSRPTHLLCVAIHADTLGYKNRRNRVTEDDLDELRQRWEIVDLR